MLTLEVLNVPKRRTFGILTENREYGLNCGIISLDCPYSCRTLTLRTKCLSPSYDGTVETADFSPVTDSFGFHSDAHNFEVSPTMNFTWNFSQRHSRKAAKSHLTQTAEICESRLLLSAVGNSIVPVHGCGNFGQLRSHRTSCQMA